MSAEPTRASAAPRLSVRGIRVRFGPQLALDGVDLDVEAGEIVALCGENGAGKSTLMKVLAGALVPEAGELALDGRPFAPRSPLEGRLAGVAMIHQELSLAPHLTVGENIVLGAEPRRGVWLDRGLARRRARDALAELGHSGTQLERRVADLGPAEAQVVEIARALVFGAKLLVLDEPTTSLDRDDVERLFERLRALRDSGVAVIYVSHVLEDVLTLCDRWIVLRDGRRVAAGDLRATATGTSPGERDGSEVRDSAIGRIVGHMVGRDVDELYPRSERSPGEVLLELRELSAPGVESVSLELRRGEVLGIAGLVGAGRTELCAAIQGLAPVRAGSIRVAGPGAALAARAATPHARWRQGVGLVSEDRKTIGLALELSSADNLCLPRLDRVARGAWLGRRDVERAAAPWLERLGVRGGQDPRAPVRSLSGGNQQKVALARLFFADVDVLLLDEPTRGIDVAAKAEIYAWIDLLARGTDGRGKGVIVVSSYLPELLGICDRIAVMCRGCLGPAHPAGERDEHEILLEASGLGSSRSRVRAGEGER